MKNEQMEFVVQTWNDFDYGNEELYLGGSGGMFYKGVSKK